MVFDVFLSFRGKDTRNGFVTHLYEALRNKKIETFIGEKLDRGDDEISPSLFKAIEESRLSIINFSKDYASSRRCLEELVKILECRQIHRQIVIPVFYGIDPSHVRNQSGNFAVAFAKHEQRAKIVSLDQEQRWKDALKEAANLSGFDSSVYKNECELIEAIVQDVSKRLNDHVPSADTSCHLVGIPSKSKQVVPLLRLGLGGGKLDMEGPRDVKLEIESLLCPGSEDVKWIESQRNRDQSSHLQANWPRRTNHNTPRDAYRVLLTIAAVILAITFYAPLIASGKLVDDIKYKSSSSLEFQVGKQSSNYLLRLFIWFDSIAFITSAAAMIIIFMHEIPLKPWMLISLLSIYGAYTCLIIAVSPRDALPVFLLGSPTILLASMSNHLPLHSILLKLLQFLWVRVSKI